MIHLPTHILRAAVTVLSLATVALSWGQAALPLYEPFNYSPGNLVGQTINGGSWSQTGSNTANAVQVVSGSLTYPGIFPMGGKIVLLNGSNYEDPGLDITGVSSGSVYASFLLNVANPGNTTGDYVAHFSPSGGSGSFYGRLYLRQGSTTSFFQLGIGHGTTPSEWSNDLPVNVPVLVVIGYTFVSGSNNDISSLWINPQLKQSTPPSANFTSTNSSSADYGTLGRICLRQGSGNTSLQVQIDELRVSTSWDNVTLPVTLTRLSVE